MKFKFMMRMDIIVVLIHNLDLLTKEIVLENYKKDNYQEIWSDEEYWGTIFYDFENDRYTYMSTYLTNGNEIERILKNWMNNKENPDDIWDGKISEDFVNDEVLADNKTRWAVDFYKSYIESGTDLDFEDYYKQTEQ